MRPSTRLPADPAQLLFGMLMLGSLLLLLKWQAFVLYVEQRYQFYSLPAISLPVPGLPGEMADFLAAQDRQVVAWLNAWQGTVPAATVQPAPAVPSRLELAVEAASLDQGGERQENHRAALALGSSSLVLFAGDSMMQGLAAPMNQALRKRKIAFRDLSRHSTGLAHPAYFDWPRTIDGELSARRVDLLIIFIGANDARDIFHKGKLLRFGSEEWRASYAERVESILRMAEDSRVRIIWVGLPPMENRYLASKTPVLNRIYQEAVEQHANSLFVASAPALTEDGKSYALHKKTAEGGILRIRADDGVHLTPSGSRLLADAVWSHVEFQ